MSEKEVKRIILSLGSGSKVTQQTILALKICIEAHGLGIAEILEADDRFGNEELFAGLANNPKLTKRKNECGWYQALKELEPKLLSKIVTDERLALKKLFNQIKYGDLLIMVGHSPLIELLALDIDLWYQLHEKRKSLDLDASLELKELEGVMFAQKYTNRNIYVTEHIGKSN